MSRLKWALALGAWLCLISLLIISAARIFSSGRAKERAFPVPLALATNFRLAPELYEGAAKALRDASQQDGEAQLALIDAENQNANKPENLRDIAESAIVSAPASARVWTTYSETISQQRPHQAATALGQALLLAPYDYYLALRRAKLSARLWPYLEPDTRRSATWQVKLLWEHTELRNDLFSLLGTPEGIVLINNTFSQEPDTLRSINRWVSARRRELESARK